MKNNLDKSLNEIEGKSFDKSIAEISSITKRVEELREVKINDLFDDDIRFLIGQGELNSILVEKGIEFLIEEPFRDTLYYEGDLLKQVVLINNIFWNSNPQLFSKFKELVFSSEFEEMKNQIEDLDEDLDSYLIKFKSIHKR